MYASFLGVILFIISSHSSYACRDGANLDDILNDPDIKRLLAQPIHPRGQLDTEPVLSERERRLDEIERLKTEYDEIQNNRNATPAEIARVRNRLLDLEAQDSLEIALARPLTLSEDSRSPVINASDDDIRRLLGEEPQTTAGPIHQDSPETLADVNEPIEVTDEERRFLEEALARPFVSRSQRSSYDVYLNDFKSASSRHPIDVRVKDPITGNLQEAEVIEFIESTETADFVLTRYTTHDGRTVTKRMRVSNLSVLENGQNINLGDPELFRDSERYAGLNQETRTAFVVDGMAQDALINESRKRYNQIQHELDSGGLSFERMNELISEQINIQRSRSPLLAHEIETIELNLEGLASGTDLSLTPGEKRAIAEIAEIRDIRATNSYVIEDREIMEKIANISEESILALRVRNRARAINREIRELTGDSLEVPFAFQRDWSSSSVSRAIGGITGRIRIKEAIDAISILDRNGQILNSDQARDIGIALRTLDSEIRSKSLQGSPQAQYLHYIRLQLEKYNLASRL